MRPAGQMPGASRCRRPAPAPLPSAPVGSIRAPRACDGCAGAVTGASSTAAWQTSGRTPAGPDDDTAPSRDPHGPPLPRRRRGPAGRSGDRGGPSTLVKASSPETRCGCCARRTRGPTHRRQRRCALARQWPAGQPAALEALLALVDRLLERGADWQPNRERAEAVEDPLRILASLLLSAWPPAGA